MHRFRLFLDLQLFASEKKVTVDGEEFEIDDSSDADDDDPSDDDDDFFEDLEVEGDEDSEEESDSDDDDAETDEDGDDSDEKDTDIDSTDEDDSDEQDEDGKTDKKKESKKGDKNPDKDGKKGADNPVAKAVIAERKRLQAKFAEANREAAATKKMMQLLGVDTLDQLQQRMDAIEAARIAKSTGVTAQQAQEQIRQARELETQRAEIRTLKYDSEVRRLKQDPFFADIEDYRDEFQEVAERTGQTLEQVYMAQRGRQRMKEYRAEEEARAAAKGNKNKGKGGMDTTSSGESVSQKTKNHGLTPEQLSVAKQAVKMGTFKDVAEYAKMLKRK